jgi:YegS/Rv2252/BmrU family lipid kinase
VKTSLIFNPTAGTRKLQLQIKEAGAYLQQQGWQITWCETAYASHATELAQQAVTEQAELVIAVGGDGTINEIVNGLIGSQTALGIFPAGTGNVFATEINLPIPGPLMPQAVKKAAQAIYQGRKQRIDVAKATFADGTVRYFLMWAGIGLDAEISHAFEADRHEKPVVKNLGLVGWLVAGLPILFRFRGKRMRIAVDQAVIDRRILWATVSNSQLYGRVWRLSPEAKLDDGLLDIVVMEGYGLHEAIKLVLLATIGQHINNPAVHSYRTKQINIETYEPIPVHLDAENVGHTPVTIEVVPQALTLILPQNAPTHLFSGS